MKIKLDQSNNSKTTLKLSIVGKLFYLAVYLTTWFQLKVAKLFATSKNFRYILVSYGTLFAIICLNFVGNLENMNTVFDTNLIAQTIFVFVNLFLLMHVIKGYNLFDEDRELDPKVYDEINLRNYTLARMGFIK